MTFIIQKIEEFSVLIGGYYAAISAGVAILGALVCFFSHRAREAMSYIVGGMLGGMIGLTVASIVLVQSSNSLVRGLITLGIASLVLYALVKIRQMGDAAMAFTPTVLAVGFPLARATGSVGVGVFVGLVAGVLVALVAVKAGRYFVICVNALVGAFAMMLGVLSCVGVLSKLYEMDSLYFFLPMLLVAALGSAYQISISPERFAAKAAKIAAEEERIRHQTAGITWSCTHCYTTNRKGNLYCRECGKTEMEPTKPEMVTLSDSANPGWRCDCGRINNLTKHRCECGTPIGEAAEWACSCGNRNGGTTDICTGCGQLRYQPYSKSYTPVEVPKVGRAGA